MKRIIQKVKRIKLGRSKPLVEAAGATALILLAMILLHPLYGAVMHLAYYLVCLRLVLGMWGRALDDYQYA